MLLIVCNDDSVTDERVRRVAVEADNYTVIRNAAMNLDEIRAMNPSKILISPGPGRPHEAGITEEIIRELGREIPVLGVCLGHQAIGEVFGADVVYAPTLMHGKVSNVDHDGKSIFENVEENFVATRYHSLVLDPETIPDVLEVTARTGDVVMGVRHKEFPIEGIQFHPESILTTEGPKMITNWLRQ